MSYIVFGAIAVGVAALIGGVATFVLGRSGTTAEKRLGEITQGKGAAAAANEMSVNLLAADFDDDEGNSFERFISKFFNLRAFVQQSGVDISPSSVVLMALVLAAAGGATGFLLPLAVVASPLLAATLGSGPFLWIIFKRKIRLGKFEKQLPEAMGLLSRSLRAGHSLGDGIHLIGDEMSDPIRSEFMRVAEQQNLGLAMEEALEELADRIPNLDLRFFVTAIVLQRQTGGDAAEILDKIGHLIRERFQLRGQVKALTGEGRLSGIVLLALPPLLAGYMYLRNPDYLGTLFTDPFGQKLLIGAIVAQFLGAIVIKKLVDIKV
jgi:tight adherence protein B